MSLEPNKTILFCILLTLQSCSADSIAPIQPSTAGISNHPFGISELRRVRINQLQEISLITTSSQTPEILLRFGPSPATRIDIRMNCSKLRAGYYFSANREEDQTISLRAYWHGIKYRRTEDQNTYSHVKFSVISDGKIRVEIRALLKEINTDKTLSVEPSIIDIPSHAFRNSLNQCY